MYIHMASIYACTYGRYSESCDIIREASHVLLEAEACKYPSAYRLGRVEWQGPLNWGIDSNRPSEVLLASCAKRTKIR